VTSQIGDAYPGCIDELQMFWALPGPYEKSW
jgi:hypothetical protein